MASLSSWEFSTSSNWGTLRSVSSSVTMYHRLPGWCRAKYFNMASIFEQCPLPCLVDSLPGSTRSPNSGLKSTTLAPGTPEKASLLRYKTSTPLEDPQNRWICWMRELCNEATVFTAMMMSCGVRPQDCRCSRRGTIHVAQLGDVRRVQRTSPLSVSLTPRLLTHCASSKAGSICWGWCKPPLARGCSRRSCAKRRRRPPLMAKPECTSGYGGSWL
mmetsp:Transcript_47165/g.109051  ORF Transcript_47165/g.109051 Transcript_47165/m.109051 type:complete len:216 (-) Transcript_47165:501-1148(-)